MDIAGALNEARRLVDDAALPDSWQAHAFNTVLTNLLSSNTPLATPGAPASNGSARGLERLGISSGALADLAVVDNDSGTVRLLIPSSKVAAVKADATRQICLLVVSLRVAVGLDDDWVDSQYIRQTLEDYGKYDSGNFSSHLKRFESEASTQRTNGRLSFRLRRPGWEKAVDLWRELAGDTRA